MEKKMNLENTKLKYQCPDCKETIILTFHTSQCPKCHAKYDNDEIKQLFYNYESQVENSTFTKVGNALIKTGDGMATAGDGIKETGNAISSLGCFIFGLPFLFILGKILGIF